ncbi:hypothetical protein [Actinoplanes awajinensis]|uniref:hypothetical protein n=1 Tax=Actinoplanes awajinensis TaxID=135946 RepID=UPI0012F73475|nr:hypothetical protein [Actinoplanes awajinensis]
MVIPARLPAVFADADLAMALSGTRSVTEASVRPFAELRAAETALAADRGATTLLPPAARAAGTVLTAAVFAVAPVRAAGTVLPTGLATAVLTAGLPAADFAVPAARAAGTVLPAPALTVAGLFATVLTVAGLTVAAVVLTVAVFTTAALTAVFAAAVFAPAGFAAAGFAATGLTGGFAATGLAAAGFAVAAVRVLGTAEAPRFAAPGAFAPPDRAAGTLAAFALPATLADFTTGADFVVPAVFPAEFASVLAAGTAARPRAAPTAGFPTAAVFAATVLVPALGFATAALVPAAGFAATALVPAADFAATGLAPATGFTAADFATADFATTDLAAVDLAAATLVPAVFAAAVFTAGDFTAGDFTAGDLTAGDVTAEVLDAGVFAAGDFTAGDFVAVALVAAALEATGFTSAFLPATRAVTPAETLDLAATATPLPTFAARPAATVIDVPARGAGVRPLTRLSPPAAIPAPATDFPVLTPAPAFADPTPAFADPAPAFADPTPAPVFADAAAGFTGTTGAFARPPVGFADEDVPATLRAAVLRPATADRPAAGVRREEPVAAVARSGVPETVLGPAPEAADLVGAFLAAGIEVFLLANDCGRVCTGEIEVRTSGRDDGLAFLPSPSGVLGIPVGIALLDCLEGPRRFVSGGERPEPILSGTYVVADLDPVVSEAPEVARAGEPTVVHSITLQLKTTMRYRFGQNAPGFPMWNWVN